MYQTEYTRVKKKPLKDTACPWSCVQNSMSDAFGSSTQMLANSG